MNELTIDLNEVVAKEIADQMKGLKKQIKSLTEQNNKLQKEVGVLKKEVDKSGISIELLNILGAQYNGIKAGESDSGGWFDSKAKNQFLFIEKILDNFFGIKKEQNGWLSNRSDGSLPLYLAVNYYSKKDVVRKLLKCLIVNEDSDFFQSNIITVFDSFVMPHDYPIEKVLQYVKNPKGNTNGCIMGVSQYWIESGGKETNMPHDLIQASPFIVTVEIFNEVLNTIKTSYPSERLYLLGIAKYNKAITDKQIQALGECLIGIGGSLIKCEVYQQFVKDNILKFNTETLDYLFKLASGENHYNLFHYQNFPYEYQVKYLMSHPIDACIKLLNDYSCKWDIKQKESFLRLRFAA